MDNDQTVYYGHTIYVNDMLFLQMFKVCPSDAILGIPVSGDCTVTCGGGTQTTTQTCVTPKGCSVNTSACDRDKVTTAQCNQEEVGSIQKKQS